MLRKFRRSIAKAATGKLLFSSECYSTLPGSLAVCNWAFLDAKERPSTATIDSKMKTLMKDSSALVDFSDPEYIDKTLAYFKMKRAPGLSIALVIGKYNSLFTFWDGEKILPLREDGLYSRTLRESGAKIVPIDFSRE